MKNSNIKNFEQKIKETIKEIIVSHSRITLFKTGIESIIFDKIKEEFITLLAHEIKTPLTSIYGNIEYIFSKYENLDPGLKKDLLIIYKNIESLRNLVEQSLNNMHPPNKTS